MVTAVLTQRELPAVTHATPVMEAIRQLRPAASITPEADIMGDITADVIAKI